MLPRRLPLFAGFISELLVFLAGLTASRLEAAEKPTAGQVAPRLAVVVIFDQLRADYLERWQELFGPDGFRRLQKEGAWFKNCYYPYANTVTAAGHASVATGCAPAEHGIVGNEWYDRRLGQIVTCVFAPRYQRVPAGIGNSSTSIAALGKENGSVSPERLLSPTLGDALKEATGGKGRVVSVSIKERSAILPGGRHPDACYWFDEGSGTFVTSSYYRDRLHSWVEEFNRGRPADRWFGHLWERLRPDLDYARWSGPDDEPGEGIGFGQGRVFPHPMSAGESKPGKNYYQAVITSPFGNDLVFQLARTAIEAEHLGENDTPDLLCLSFSSNDLIGHCWGPDSQEVLDVTLRSDRILAELLALLDARVGKGCFVLAVTADHGVCPLPEVARVQGKDAVRVAVEPMLSAAEVYLDSKFGKRAERERWFAAKTEMWIYLNSRLLQQRGLQAAEVEKVLAGWLKQQGDVVAAYTRTQLLSGAVGEDAIGHRVLRSFHSERSGDLAVILKPYRVPSGLLGTGTTHGTPHAYDTHVPLLLYGTDLPPGPQVQAVSPLATAFVVARALGIPPPARAEAFTTPERPRGTRESK